VPRKPALRSGSGHLNRFILQRTINYVIGPATNKRLGRGNIMAAKNSAVVSELKIREISHQLWVEAGKPEGQAEDHWFKAIELAARTANAKSTEKAKPAAKAAAKPLAKKAPAKKTK
jgi:hypothetical protein